jgi:hypothetical protein
MWPPKLPRLSVVSNLEGRERLAAMTPEDLEKHTKEIVSSLSFAWISIDPLQLQLLHSLALKAMPETTSLPAPPLDNPVTDMEMGIQISPSKMQNYFVSAVIPVALIGLQSIAEETMTALLGESPSIKKRLDELHAVGKIDASLLSEAHHWRQAALQAPYHASVGVTKTPIVKGNQVEVGLGDVYACGMTWANVLRGALKP